MNKVFLCISCYLFLCISCVNKPKTGFAFKFQNPAYTLDERIDDLSDRLTVDEKTNLLLYNSPPIERLDIHPYNWWNECLHGVARAGRATVFPQVIGMAATFDPVLIREIGTAVSDEARAKHNDAIRRGSFGQYTGLTFWTPNINIFRDPRWGRGQETFGEDPFLTASLASAYVQGLQGDHPVYLKTAACAKHFALGSGPESIRHTVNAKPPLSDFYNTYLPAFEALVEADVEAVMCAYNRLYDAPCCGSSALLRKLLREDWGFKGHIVSDCWALDDIWLRHKTVESKTQAALMAAEAGVNINCGYIYSYLDTAFLQGLITEAQVAALLKPALRTRFKLGEFDPPEMNPYTSLSSDVVNCERHRSLAYEAAQKSFVLLKNADNTLPLHPDQINRLLVTGPLAADPALLMGNYNGLSGDFVTILEGISRQAPAGMVVAYSPGTTLDSSNHFHGAWQAADADATIVVLGYSYLLEGEEGDAMLSTHGGDRTDLKLPENQIELLRRLRSAARDKPLIVLLGAGSAVNINEILELADAVIMVWYPGEQGGNAAADILFGKANPSGKLPITFYESVADLPPFDDYSMQGRTYRYMEQAVQFPFGYGLSYSNFHYASLSADQQYYKNADTIMIKCMVSNTAGMDGEEVVQLYASRHGRSTDEPIKTLVDFKRIFVPSGQTRELQFAVPTHRLRVYAESCDGMIVKSGSYTINTGTDSEASQLSIMVEVAGK